MLKKRKNILRLSVALFLLSICLPALALEVDYPAVSGQSPGTSLTTYIRYIFIFFVSITGFLAVLFLAIGSVEYMTSVGDVGKMKSAKSKIISSSLGILLLLSSYLILYTINPNLTNLQEPTIAQLASVPLPKAPISVVPTADLLTRIKILAEDTEQVPDVIYNSAKLISLITDNCDCSNTRATCSCEQNLKCPQTPWYTVYSHLDKIYHVPISSLVDINGKREDTERGSKKDLNVGDEVKKGDIIGEVGKLNTEIGPHLHFQLGFKPSPGDSVLSIDITSKISAPGGIKGSRPSGAKSEELPSTIGPDDTKYILSTLTPPLKYDQCVWYETMDSKDSPAHDGKQYWAQNWRCLSDDLTESAEVYVISGDLNNIPLNSSGEIESTVESINKDTGDVIIKHKCVQKPTVDIKANDSDGPITVPNNSSVVLTWTSTNADSCTASGSWGSNKSLSGTETVEVKFIPNFFEPGGSGTSIFTITCTGHGGTSSDSVTVNISGVGMIKIKSLASIESLGDITCDSPLVHYFYNNSQNEGCCNSNIDAGGTETLCGPAGNQKCCSSGTPCVSDGTSASCCSDTFCAPIAKEPACCSGLNPICRLAYYNFPTSGYKGVCCPSDKTKLCYDQNDKAAGTACCKGGQFISDLCVKSATGFSCCDPMTSQVCGNPGSQVCCTNPTNCITSATGGGC
ncbi:MAG: hypothetical protein NTY47_07295 [Candidatus Omnitrophica bacterium]|nr:hypothetical protein [Candidatus Omnitrophota bacterium]